MTQTFLRHTLSTLAAIALVAFTSCPAFAEEPQQTIHDERVLKNSQAIINGSKTPEGTHTSKPSSMMGEYLPNFRATRSGCYDDDPRTPCLNPVISDH